MIRSNGFAGYDVNCDKCGFSEQFDSAHWDHLMIEMKAYGWKNRKVDEEWQHRCSSCQSD